MKKIVPFFYLVIMCSFVSCSPKSHYQSTLPKGEDYADSIISASTIQRIKLDMKDRHLWVDTIEKVPSSKCLYEAHAGNGLYLYSVNGDACEMLDYAGIYWQKDFIDCTDTTGIEYEWKGEYKIIEDSMVYINANEYYRLSTIGNEHSECSPFLQNTYRYEYVIRNNHFIKLLGDSIIVQYTDVQEDCARIMEKFHLID